MKNDQLELPLADSDASSFARNTRAGSALHAQPSFRRHHKRKSSTIYVPPRSPVTDAPAGDMFDNEDGRRALIAGATSFAGAQLFARLATFALNQLLVRRLSAANLGAGSQVELAATSMLALGRDGVRISSQRRAGAPRGSAQFTTLAYPRYETRRGMLQETVNLGWLSMLAGTLFTAMLTTALLRRGSWPALAVTLTAAACGVELASEPCFLLLQRDLQLRVRARAEGLASVARVATVALTALALGTPPFVAFALGQLVYAGMLAGVYFAYAAPAARREGCSLFPRRIAVQNSARFLAPDTLRSVREFAQQQLVKYFLTEGDKLAIGLTASLAEQGEYALAANYGALVVRFVLYPVEEALRAYFARTKDTARAREALTSVLRAYSYLMLLCALFAPLLAPYALRAVLRVDSVGVARVLGAYCWYIPVLAYNGALEAFVHAAMSLQHVRSQAVVLAAAGTVFAALVYALVAWLHVGSVGLVYAQLGATLVRLVWSARAVSEHFASAAWLMQCAPHAAVAVAAVAAGVGARVYLSPVRTLSAFVGVGALAAAVVAAALVSERRAVRQLLGTRR